MPEGNKRQVLDSLRQTKLTVKPQQFSVLWDQLPTVGVEEGARTGAVQGGQEVGETGVKEDLLELLLAETVEGRRLGLGTGVPEFVLTPELLERLGRKFPMRLFGKRLLSDGKRKRTSAFDAKSGVVHVTLLEGFLQLVDGLIEIFFNRAELTLGNFFDS